MIGGQSEKGNTKNPRLLFLARVLFVVDHRESVQSTGEGRVRDGDERIDFCKMVMDFRQRDRLGLAQAGLEQGADGLSHCIHLLLLGRGAVADVGQCGRVIRVGWVSVLLRPLTPLDCVKVEVRLDEKWN